MNSTNELGKQLSWHWENALRPRLEGLVDREYFWEPVPGMWSVRSGRIDLTYPPPTPEPVTTIAWRIGHLLVGVFGERIARHFGGPAISHAAYIYRTDGVRLLGRASVLHGVRIMGMTDTNAVSRRFSLDEDTVEELLLDHESFGWVRRVGFGDISGWALTEIGREQDNRLLAAQLTIAGARDSVARSPASFIDPADSGGSAGRQRSQRLAMG